MLSERKMPGPSIFWDVPGHNADACPACTDTSKKQYKLAVRSLLPPNASLPFAGCDACGTIFIPGYVTPDYSDISVSDYASRFYIEQGAGVEQLARPAFSIASRGGANRYLEIGCGYGFGVDIAARCFGWDARGIDPSPIAQRGARELGLRIEARHLTPDAADEPERYDAIVAMEVVEHVPEPRDFLKMLRGYLSPDGAIFLSTPNARIIENRSHPLLEAALSPGYHITIFSREGLATALRDAGFENVDVQATETNLVASATLKGPGIDLSQEFDREKFADYLSGRMSMHDPGSPIWMGFAYRRYKDLVNRAQYASADPLFERIATALRMSRGIDIKNPLALSAEASNADEWLNSGRWPFCLAGLLFLRGIQLINTDWNPKPPYPYFLATVDVGNAILASLSGWGAVDGELQVQVAAAEEPIRMCRERMAQK